MVIDDPMTSLDEHRSVITVQEMRRLEARLAQMIVLSHSKPFLSTLGRRGHDDPVGLARCPSGDRLHPAVWDVRQDCITEHDRRHELVERYLQASDPATELAVAAALRPILEAFMRVAYPSGLFARHDARPFHNILQRRLSGPNQLFKATDIAELRAPARLREPIPSRYQCGLRDGDHQ
ncbi:hypothetical protein [Bradyrhizobium neotropicale]|uniref:hypothetical protein n=1 Tax=Bradyrhizobium neotropicale TaxID=1497615 RepID=UPI001AD76FC3|nr:hypothetical protein [Bradyrhizobium neotropicale]MBO4228089.1 hypothetical protein [Bradyrhizobium neotropicale]